MNPIKMKLKTLAPQKTTLITALISALTSAFILASVGTTKVQAFTFGCSDCSTLEGWDTKTLSFDLNATDCPSDIVDDIDEAFSLWNSISSSGLKLELGAETDDDVDTVIDRVDDNPVAHNPVIICDPDFQNTFGLSDDQVNGILGVASFNVVSGSSIDTGYLVLNAQADADANLADQDKTTKQIVIAHEIGHVLGLGHSSEESALMFFNVGEKVNLNLGQDDVDGINYLYPRNEPSDGLYGCGSIRASGGGSPPPPSIFISMFLFLPLLLLAQQKLKSITVKS